ncbi:polysaccharide deacetylase family protein [Flavihumibacter sediminis]|nr:polysaccharide deacetylase family protein [Flavihumibacter sediminis]
MKMLKDSFGFLLYKIGRIFPFDHTTKVLSLYCHRPSVSFFESLILWLRENGFRLISLTELEKLLEEGIAKDKCVVITLDDAHISNNELLPSIEKYKVPVTIFAPVDPLYEGSYWWDYVNANTEGMKAKHLLRKWKMMDVSSFDVMMADLRSQKSVPRTSMTVEELQKAANVKTIEIGAHTVSHPILTQCEDERIRMELEGGRSRLYEIIGKQIKYLAYPNGNYSEKIKLMARSSGYKLAFTVEQRLIDLKTDDWLALPRFALNEEGGRFENLARVMGTWQKFFFWKF